MMIEFIEKLNKEQLKLLKKIEPDYLNLTTEDLDEVLTIYFQEHGLEDIESNPEQLLLESILDILGSM